MKEVQGGKADYIFWRGLSVAVLIVNIMWAINSWRFPNAGGPPIFEFVNVFYFAYCAGRLLVEVDDDWGSGSGMILVCVASFFVMAGQPGTGLDIIFATLSSLGIGVSLMRHGRRARGGVD